MVTLPAHMTPMFYVLVGPKGEQVKHKPIFKEQRKQHVFR
jgi:hypothetical protein